MTLHKISSLEEFITKELQLDDSVVVIDKPTIDNHLKAQLGDKNALWHRGYERYLFALSCLKIRYLSNAVFWLTHAVSDLKKAESIVDPRDESGMHDAIEKRLDVEFILDTIKPMDETIMKSRSIACLFADAKYPLQDCHEANEWNKIADRAGIP